MHIEKIEKEFTAKVEFLTDFLEFSKLQAEKYAMPEERILHFELVLEEVFVNVACYAYESDFEGKVLIKYFFDKKNRHFTIEVIDSGKPFNPLHQPFPNVENDIDGREVGGLGILFIRKMTQDIYYKRNNEKNIFGLVFYV